MARSAAQHCASRAFTDDILYYWAIGLDSAEIADILSCSEALIYNILARLQCPGHGVAR